MALTVKNASIAFLRIAGVLNEIVCKTLKNGKRIKVFRKSLLTGIYYSYDE
jgi:hypothetical protein